MTSEFQREIEELRRVQTEAEADFALRFDEAERLYHTDARFRRSLYAAAQHMHGLLLTGLAPAAIDPDARSELATRLALTSWVVFDFYAERDLGGRPRPRPTNHRY